MDRRAATVALRPTVAGLARSPTPGIETCLRRSEARSPMSQRTFAVADLASFYGGERTVGVSDVFCVECGGLAPVAGA
jgi:hypothetical protein